MLVPNLSNTIFLVLRRVEFLTALYWQCIISNEIVYCSHCLYVYSCWKRFCQEPLLEWIINVPSCGCDASEAKCWRLVLTIRCYISTYILITMWTCEMLAEKLILCLFFIHIPLLFVHNFIFLSWHHQFKTEKVAMKCFNDFCSRLFWCLSEQKYTFFQHKFIAICPILPYQYIVSVSVFFCYMICSSNGWTRRSIDFL